MSAAADDVKSVFGRALERSDPAARAAYLAEVCGGNAALRAEVDALLAAHDRAGGFLGHAPAPDDGTGVFASGAPATAAFGAAPAAAPTADYAATDEHAGAVIAGRYTLVEPIGEGGMGAVWRAKQTEPVKRFVAVKLIKAGMDSKQVLARFEAERQALALMDHPNIAKVLDGGLHAGRPYFVMELVKGVPITDYCDARKLTPRERLGLFVPVCQAIQHAHQKGVIHRDIKPSNVLVALYDDRPVVKVIDFGVAKATGAALTERTIDTGFGGVVGTPQYMSPEQATFNNLDIDTRTDVYALGVLLYELLAGSPPFARRELEKRGLLEILRVVREEEPPRPSTKLSTADALPTLSANRGTEPKKLTGLLRNELDWIVMKALEKDRARRYDTANGFAADVLRYLSGEAVLAHPPSAAYRVKKFVRRHKGRVVAAGLVLVALLAGIAGTTGGLLEARRQGQAARAEADEKEEARRAEAARVAERDAALAREGLRAGERDKANDELRHRLGVSDMVLAGAAFDKHDLPLAVERLDRVPAAQRGWEWRYLERQARGGLFTLYGHTTPVSSAAFSPDGTRLLTAADVTFERGVEVMVWDARTGEPLFELTGLEPPRVGVGDLPVRASFSPDGGRIVVGGGEAPAGVWDARTGKLLLELNEPLSTTAALSPDGTRIVTGSLDGFAKVWDAATGALLFDLGPESQWVLGAAFSPDGTRLATCGRIARVWDAKTGAALFRVKAGGEFVAFSPDGTRLATGSLDAVQVWDARDGKAVGPELRHRVRRSQELMAGGLGAVAFSPDGTRIATGGGIGKYAEARVWDARSGAVLLELTGHQAPVRAVAFSPDGTRVVTGSSDRTVTVWDAGAESPRVELRGHQRVVTAVALSPDGTRALTAGGQVFGEPSAPGRATVWDARTGAPLLELRGFKGGVNDAAFSPDGTRILTGGSRNFDVAEVKLWDARTGALLLELAGFKEGVQSVAFSPDGARIATGGLNEGRLIGAEVKVWDARTGALVLDLTHSFAAGDPTPVIGPRGWRVAFSPDGGRLLTATGGPSGVAKVWDLRTGAVAAELNGLSGFVQSAGFSPDGERVVTGGSATATVWDARTGAPVLELKGHTGDVNAVVFSSDGTRIFTGSGDQTVRVWDARTGTSLVELNGHVGYLTSLAFSRDGTRLVAGGRGEAGQPGQAMVWDLPPQTPAPTLTGHTNSILQATFSPDGTRLATSSYDSTVRLWDVRTGQTVRTWKGVAGEVWGVGFAPDGNRILTARIEIGGRSEVKVWDVATGAERIELKGWEGMALSAAFSSDGTRIVGTAFDKAPRVWDAGTGAEIPGAPVPETVPARPVSPDGKLFAYSDTNNSVRIVPRKPDAAERASRLLRTEPDVGRYLEGYLAARAAKDDFAATFYAKWIPESRRAALIAKAEMDALDVRVTRQQRTGQAGDQGLLLVLELLDRKKALLGPEDPDTLEVMNVLGTAYRDAARLKRPELFDKAAGVFEELLTIREAKFGPRHPDTIAVLDQLGRIYRQRERIGKAIPLLERLVKVRDETLGRTHPDTRNSIQNLALCYGAAGRPDAAVLLLEEAHRAAKDEPQIANDLIDAYTQIGQYDKAVHLLQERLAEARKSPERDNYVLLDALYRLGRVYLQQQKWAEAEPLLRECLAGHEKSGQSRETLLPLSALGASLSGQKKYAEAEPLLLRAYAGIKRWDATVPSALAALSDVLDRLIELSAATNKPDEVKKWRAERAKYPSVAPPPREK
jgi:WD40 repeat protein/tetratricopeptide (TPR) repeat protein